MTVVPRGSGHTRSHGATSSGGHAKTDATAGATSSTKDATAKAAALGGSPLRSRLAGRLADLADNTSSQTKQAAKEGLARATAFGRDSVLPEIGRTGAKLKEHARPERLKQNFKAFLHWLNARVFDPPKEHLFFAPTKDRVPLSRLTIHSPNREHGHDYRPSPCQVLQWALAGINYDLSKLTFIDHGAGKGRVLLLAAEHPFAAVGGIEFAEELHDDAKMNIAQYPRSHMLCRNVECVLGDAAEVGPHEGEAVHYFFNPFSREVFAEVLGNIVASYRHKPRRLYLILVDPIATDLVDASGVFARVEIPLHERLKIRLFSPYNVAIFRSLA
ncbi:MAG: class I SAM-dependent methyltransferase [Alphaproteobacteria bacterium]